VHRPIPVRWVQHSRIPEVSCTLGQSVSLISGSLRCIYLSGLHMDRGGSARGLPVGWSKETTEERDVGLFDRISRPTTRICSYINSRKILSLSVLQHSQFFNLRCHYYQFQKASQCRNFPKIFLSPGTQFPTTHFPAFSCEPYLFQLESQDEAL